MCLSISIAYKLCYANSALWLRCTIITFVLSTPSIRTGSANAYCWEASCLLSQTWDSSNCCLSTSILLCFRTCGPCFLCPLNFSSSLLLFHQFLSNAITLSYHCSIELGCYFDSISLWDIIPFMSLLNSLTKSLLSYSLSFITFLNF